MKKPGRFHVITDTVMQNRFSHSELAEMAIRGGADTIQFRQKEGSARELINAARSVKHVCEKAGVLLIINDRIDIAMAVNADGVHLGQDDFPISSARKILGRDRIIGGSAGNQKEAIKCLSEGVDYIGFGPFYKTDSKKDAGPAAGILKMKDVMSIIDVPLIAIGGIDAGNLSAVMEGGAYGIAVISAVCCAEDPETASLRIKEAMKIYLS